MQFFKKLGRHTNTGVGKSQNTDNKGGREQDQRQKKKNIFEFSFTKCLPSKEN